MQAAGMSGHNAPESSDKAMATPACLVEKQITQGGVQRLPMDHELFAEGNLHREVLAKQTAVSRGVEPVPLFSHSSTEAMYDEHAWECTSCGHLLLTARQLDIHVQEVHDSFFQAQAARSMKVFECLVEGCSKKFTTPLERKQHLADFHRYPQGYQYETLHLGKLQSPFGPWQSRRHNSSHAHASQASSQSEPPSRVQAVGVSTIGDSQLLEDATSANNAVGAATASHALHSMDMDSLATGMSKLSSCDSEVPPVAAFGRRNRRRAFS